MYFVEIGYHDWRECETAGEAAQEIIDNLDEALYDEMLDECYPDIDICGYDYSPSEALKRVDEVAYRCGMNDYYDSLTYEIKDELLSLDDGEGIEIYGISVEYKDSNTWEYYNS